MHNCLKSLDGYFNRIIVDGNRFPIYENKNDILVLYASMMDCYAKIGHIDDLFLLFNIDFAVFFIEGYADLIS